MDFKWLIPRYAHIWNKYANGFYRSFTLLYIGQTGMTKEGSTIILNLMNPGAEVLVLGLGHISHIAKMHNFFKNLLLYSKAWFRQTKCIVMMTKEGGSTKTINFMTPEEGVLVLRSGHISHIANMHNFFKNRQYFQTWIRQTNHIIMMTKKGSTKIVTFMIPGSGVLVLGRGHISHIVKIHISLEIVFSTPRHQSDKWSIK